MPGACLGPIGGISVGPAYAASQSGGTVEGPVRAAQYVRMSTDHQKYSTENQAEALQRYPSCPRSCQLTAAFRDI